MGAHCGKWCCKPCRKQVDVTDKVKDLFNLPDSESAEHHATQKGSKLCSYLKDRLDQVTKCGKLIEDKTKDILNQEQWSQRDADIIKIALIALKILATQFPQHFMSQAYTFSYRLISDDHFSRVKQLTYDLVTQCARGIQLESSAVSDQFLQELIQYCEVNSSLIGREEFSLLGLLIAAHPLAYEINSDDPQQRKWTRLLEMVLKHLLSDMTMESGSLVEEEKQLLTTLLGTIACNVKTTNYLCTSLLQFIQNNIAWGPFSDLVLDLLFDCFVKKKDDYLAEMFKTFVFFLHSVVSDSHANPSHVKFFVRKLIVCLEQASGSVPTLTYNATLQEALLSMISRVELKATGLDLLIAWCNKTDQQSFLKLMHQLVVDERADHNYDVCLTHMKRHLQSRIERGARDGLFDDLNREVAQLTTLMHDALPSVLTLKTLAFLGRLLRGRLKLKQYEANSLHDTLINQLGVISNELTYQSIKMHKYCSEIWLCLTALGQPSHTDGLVRLAYRLEKLGRKTTSGSMQMAMLVLLLVHVNALGAFHNARKLSELADRASKTYLPRDLYPGIFERDRWDLVCSFKLRLFRKAQFGLFERCQGNLAFGSLQLQEALREVFPQVEAEREDEGTEWRNSSDPLETMTIESSIYSQFSDLGGRSADISDINPEILTGAAAVARREDEQQKLLQRLAGKS